VAAGGLSHKRVRVDVLLGDVDFASSGRGEDAVPTKSLWRKLARVAATHYLPVRFHAPEGEYRTTKCCCACGGVTTPATTRLRRCVSAQCTAPREAEAGAAAGRDGRGGGEEDGQEEEATHGNDPSFPQSPRPRAPDASRRPKKGVGKLRHRDLNGSRNMLMILAAKLAGHPRPSWLTPVEIVLLCSGQ